MDNYRLKGGYRCCAIAFIQMVVLMSTNICSVKLLFTNGCSGGRLPLSI
jgi:hypothetical protein